MEEERPASRCSVAPARTPTRTPTLSWEEAPWKAVGLSSEPCRIALSASSPDRPPRPSRGRDRDGQTSQSRAQERRTWPGGGQRGDELWGGICCRRDRGLSRAAGREVVPRRLPRAPARHPPPNLQRLLPPPPGLQPDSSSVGPAADGLRRGALRVASSPRPHPPTPPVQHLRQPPSDELRRGCSRRGARGGARAQRAGGGCALPAAQAQRLALVERLRPAVRPVDADPEPPPASDAPVRSLTRLPHAARASCRECALGKKGSGGLGAGSRGRGWAAGRRQSKPQETTPCTKRRLFFFVKPLLTLGRLRGGSKWGLGGK